MDFLDSLNPSQKEAVRHTEGPLLILAGAGSGKTRVIISRIAHLIRDHGVAPHAILAVTFTNKAAQEMRDRVGAVLAESGAPLNSFPLVSTFHSFCVRVLRAHGAPLADLRSGFTRSFSIYDENDQVAAIKAVYRGLGLDEKFMKPRSALSVISHAKNQGRGPQDFYSDSTGPASDKLAVIFERYQEALHGSNAFDFDDLLLECVRLLRHSEETRQRLRDRYQYLLVDEYQDTNRPQYELMQLLTGERQTVCVVGDEDQSIYSWRGADIRNILDFERDYPGATVIRLEQNYRSTKHILAAAGAVVANNIDRKGKTLWTDSAPGHPVGLYHARDADEEAGFVADTIDRYLTEHPTKQAAVLYRTNSQSRQIEEALRRRGREYLVLGGVSFYQRAEVKDLLAYLKLASSPADSVSLTRVINTPARGIGRTTVESIATYAQGHGLSLWDATERMLAERVFSARAQSAVRGFRYLIEGLREKIAQEPVHTALQWIVEQSGYKHMLERDASIEAEGRLENINEFINAAFDAEKRGDSLHDFLDHAALVSDTDSIDRRAKVILMTLHSAKGLEFPLVIMTGVEENIFPHSRSIESTAALEEERRLCYVGMTRAEEQLILTCARQRRRYGGGAPDWMTPSRFLQEIPPEVMTDLSTMPSLLSYQQQSYQQQDEGMDLLSERNEVRQAVKKRVYDGPTYDSVDNLAGFFSNRGLPVPNSVRQPQPKTGAPAAKQTSAAAVRRPPQARGTGRTHGGGFLLGAKVRHRKFGVGTVMKSEGDGAESKLTVHFQSHGIKKLVARFAGLVPA